MKRVSCLRCFQHLSLINIATQDATGVTTDTLAVYPTESAEGWNAVLEKKGEVQKVDLFIADGLPGLEEKILASYPISYFQKCVVHFKRNTLRRVRTEDKKAIAADMTLIYLNIKITVLSES